MKKIKISFAAVAFLLATGAAFATKSQSHTSNGLERCTTVEDPKLNQCRGDEIEPCCETESQETVFYDPEA